MSADELVVRLQATLDEREREFQRVAEELREAARAKVSIPNALYLRASVGEGLRLVQSHRDLIDEWRKQAQIRDQLADEAKGSDEHLTAVGITAGLRAAVTLMARGYGLEET